MNPDNQPPDHTPPAPPPGPSPGPGTAEPTPTPTHPGNDPQVPDSLAGAAFAAWGDGSYGPAIFGSGASKLGGSVVAPLVALARGYRTLTQPSLRDLIADNGFHAMSVPAKQLRAAVGDRDALLMPWYTPTDVATYWAQPGLQDPDQWYDTRPSALQYRPHPANVVTDSRGKKAKYQNLAGQQTVMGVHPATPATWVTDGNPTLLVTEGLLKADSAITAYLRAYGATDTDLTHVDGVDVRLARSRMAHLLEQVDPRHRVLFVSISGVGMWRQNPEWSSLRAKGNHVWVAFDGDIATKAQVWKQAKDLFGFITAKGGTPMLLDLSGQPCPAGGKVGVDDFLAQGHDWHDLIANMTTRLPPAPASDEATARYRMHEPTLTFQEKTDPDPAAGTPPRWETRAAFVARVLSVDQRRSATGEELETGTLSPRAVVRPENQTCQVELSWHAPDGTRQCALIDGNADMLMTRPDRWREPRINARIPAAVLRLPQWPPRCDGFLEAMKTWRPDEVIERSSWEHMGWVPTETTPVFIVGKQVIGPDGDCPQLACSAVTDQTLSGASQFGVQVPSDDDLDEVRQAVRTVLRRYRACWADPAHASVVIAAALRPTVPRPASLPVLLSGTTAAGKTFSSAAIMAFWQARPGDWTGQSLPGSSADTAASTEHALARTPIWVMDDLAPSATDPARQARAADTMNEIIRAVFNNAAHRRMTRDLTSRAAESPRAVFVCSAEAAPLSNHSVMNRLVHIRVQPGFLVPQRGPTDALIEMSQTSNEQSLLTGYALLLNARAAQRDWPGERRGWADDAAGVERQVRHVIDTRFTKAAYAERVARTVADLSLGLVMLERVIDSLRIRDEQFGDPVRPEASFGEVLESMFEDIMQVALDGVCEGKDIAPGRTTIARLRSLLGSAKAHIAASDGTPGAPMVAGEDGCSPDANAVNQALGWVLTGDSNRPATPGGVRVGWLHRGGDGQPMVLADPGALFNLVRREFGRDGHSQKSLFDALWAEGFCTERHWKRKQTGKGLCYTVRVSTAGQMLNVIPLTLQLVLGNDGEDDG